MPKPNQRNKKRRKVYRKTPGGKTVTKHEDRKPGKAECGNCGAELHGVPHRKPSQLQKLSKSKKRPERPFGGNLCSKCMRDKIKAGIDE